MCPRFRLDLSQSAVKKVLETHKLHLVVYPVVLGLGALRRIAGKSQAQAPLGRKHGRLTEEYPIENV